MKKSIAVSFVAALAANAMAQTAAPKPERDLVVGTSSYQAAIAMGGQNLTMSIVRTVKDEGAHWLISENAKMPMGEALDEALVEKRTLLVKRRSVRQGAMSVDLAFDDVKATGKVSVGGQEKIVAIDLPGPLFADGAGANDVLARLPLAAGYVATFRNLDVQRQKVGLKQIKVNGSESITVPAGTFETWKAEVSSAEGEPGVTTLWIDTKSRRVVKILSTRPQGTITAELQP
jgi:hypothetical protein